MKKLVLYCSVFLLMVLTACGCDGGSSANLVVLNLSGTPVYAVQVGDEVVSNADGSPMEAGSGSRGFEVSRWPVEVTVYGDLACREPLSSRTVGEVPEGAERWYISVQDGADGLELEAGETWPEQ